MATDASNSGLLDLETELTCSICTEILYQPLTLLDCLHTFCGSCLKLWFEWQASQAAVNGDNRRVRSQQNPYTCPSCRAKVRDTRPDPRVTTLLDMFLQANPDKRKTEAEKGDIKKKYTPGTNVLLKAEDAPAAANAVDDMDELDRRMIEEVRQMSLREVQGGRNMRGYERGIRHRNRSPREDRREGAEAARQLEHQTSLRALVSMDEASSSDMQREILRQIEEDGLLDGVDINSLDPNQEEELSERIAEAYRRRHVRQRSQDARAERAHRRRGSDQPSSRRQPAHSPAEEVSGIQSGSVHPPISRPHLLNADVGANGQRRHRRSVSSEGRRQTSPSVGSSRTQPPQARSVTDLSDRPSSSEARSARSTENRRNTDSRAPPGGGAMTSHDRRRPSVSSQDNRQVLVDSPSLSSSQRSPRMHNDSPTRIEHSPGQSRRADSENLSPQSTAGPPQTSSPISTPFVTPAPAQHEKLYNEPLIACNRCDKQNIQYEVHEHCSICNDGDYDICYRCYRLGRGCLHFFGLGDMAWQKFQNRASGDTPLPHTLSSRKYLEPDPSSFRRPNNVAVRLTVSHPTSRLKTGIFCSICRASASNCFYKCSICADGEWVYCTSCVNTGRSCTHALLPLSHNSTPASELPRVLSITNAGLHSEAVFAPLASNRQLQAYPPISTAAEYRPLQWRINCDNCHWPIQPNQSRYHCPQCNDGEYDICQNCYAKLCDAGRISAEDGDKGWRKCPRGHRMVVIFFEDMPEGQRRVLVRDLVGGLAFKDGDFSTGPSFGSRRVTWSWNDGQGQQTRSVDKGVSTTQTNGNGIVGLATPPLLKNFPPDGGAGMRLIALYPWVPEEGVTNELSFPRGAEIREVFDINGDWFGGVYAGSEGLFPSNYGRVIATFTW